LKVANLYKGKYVYYYTDKHGRKRKVKFSYAPIKLPALKNKDLTLVIIHGRGKEPMMLITNIKPKAKKLTLAILKAYIKRWKIEEYFRFKKQQFDYYAIADGIKGILEKTTSGIKKFLKSYYLNRQSHNLRLLSLPI